MTKKSSNLKISKVNIERVPLHKRIDKEVYQSDLERFYTDTYDRKINNVGATCEPSDAGTKINKLQEEMSKQKAAHRTQEEHRRQSIAPELVNKPKTNAQRLDKFIL